MDVNTTIVFVSIGQYYAKGYSRGVKQYFPLDSRGLVLTNQPKKTATEAIKASMRIWESEKAAAIASLGLTPAEIAVE